MKTKYDWSGVDWSVAPNWAESWGFNDWVSSKKESWWISKDRIEKAPDFNYQGNWQDSLEERPNE